MQLSLSHESWNGVIGMTKKTVLGMPRKVFYVVCSVLVIGIIIGSFYDYQISVALSNTTGIGDFYQHYGNIISHLLFAFAVVWIVVLGYNRIHMNAHFLTDVCFGVLITYCLYALAYKFAFSVFDEVPSKDK